MRKCAPKLFEDVFIKQQLLKPWIEHESVIVQCTETTGKNKDDTHTLVI